MFFKGAISQSIKKFNGKNIKVLFTGFGSSQCVIPSTQFDLLLFKLYIYFGNVKVRKFVAFALFSSNCSK